MTAAQVAAEAAPEPFDLLGPLPEGTTVLEASAGTGKTYTIANLVARYVAGGVAMEELLVVSFSRESTRELRERVRERLVSARDGLAHPASIVAADDPVLALLADADPAEVAVRRRRLEQALTVFDAATVTTTHGFCQQVLLALGTAGDHDTGAVLVESIGDLVAEVADDLYLRKWGAAGSDPADMSRADFHALAMAAATDPATDLLPVTTADGLPGQRARVAAAVRAEVDRRKRRQQLIDYDDMLLRLRNTLVDPTSGPIAKARLRARYRVVLVDEFQDTDPVQWTILREAFHDHRTLVLIGDPKQAIYGFRGADVHAYLEARASASVVRTLPRNHRSDAGLLAGMTAVFGGAALGDERIRVLPVEAAHTGRLVEAAVPLQLRVVPRDGLTLLKNGTVKTGQARDVVARDLADQVVALLAGGTVVRPRDGGDERPVAPGDIAVLVRYNSQAQLVQAALRAADVPVVLTGKTSVFATPAAAEWQRLLEALEQPHRSTRVRRAALTCFVGKDAAGLDAAGDAFADDLALKLRIWGAVLAERGVAAMFEALSLDLALQPRILGQVGGERLLTDLRHIAQVMHEATLEGQLGLTALLVWLRRRREEAGREGGQERSRRLETDAAAVQVITVHTSKGLEFPVVLVPFGWDNWGGREPATAVFHDEHDRRVRDVGGPGSPDWAAHARAHKQEETDDELRLTYVALTRAQSHLLVWWAPSYNTPTSPLHRLLLHDSPTVAPLQVPVPDDATALAAFRARATRSDGGLAVELVRERPPEVWSPVAGTTPTLQLAAFTRALDTGWRRTSYSALTSAAHELRLGSEPEVGQKDDETDLEEAPAGDGTDDGALRGVPSAWDAIPGGAAFGTLVHTVLEQLADPADDAALTATVAGTVARFAPDLDPGALTVGLRAALATPLGDLAGGAALREVDAHDRLPELDFELPLAGGDDALSDAALADVFLRDLVPLWRAQVPTGLLSSYADALAELPDVPLRGYLTGSVDAVLRIGGADPRYLVVDYKTNRLGGTDEPLTAWHYRGCRARDRDGRGALPAAGAAVRRGAAPLPALAAARLRPGRAPRRGAVPVPARHVRAGRARRRRCGARGVLLAAADRAGHRNLRPAGRPAMTATHDASLALRATGLLSAYNRAGILTAADVHVAQRLGRIGGESDDAVLLAAALVVRSTRHGSVVLDLATAPDTTSPDVDEDAETPAAEVALDWPADWVARCAASPLVGTTEAGGPLRMAGSRLWLARYWDQEEQVAAELRGRSAAAPDDLDAGVLEQGLARLFGAGDDDQRQAAQACAGSWVSVLAGGPGTGKTTTVSRLLALLREQHPGWRIALAAPTGKAAARLEEAVRSSTALLPRRGPGAARRAVGHHAAPAARLAAGRAQPVPARPHQPAPGRGGGGRRGVDGVADDDGPAARGAAAVHPAGAGRRPGPAGLGRGRRGAR